MTTYADIASKLTGRCANRRKVANNTYLERRGDNAIALRLHNTDVVTFTPDHMTFDTGGWRTVTTKSRMNDGTGVRIYSQKGTWYLHIHGADNWDNDVLYFDGIQVSYDGKIVNAELIPVDTSAEVRKLKREISKFAKLCTDKLAEGMPLPGNGDCWYCLMHADPDNAGNARDNMRSLGDATHNHEHLRSHMAEGYAVPSLIFDAVKEAGYRHPGIILGVHEDTTAAGGHMLGGMRTNALGECIGERAITDSVRRAIVKYLKRRLLPQEEGSKPVGTPAHTGGW